MFQGQGAYKMKTIKSYIKSNMKKTGYAILAALFTLASIHPAGAAETPQTPTEPPAFAAHVEWTGVNGYVVTGTFTEFTSDIKNIQPMYSLDGQSYLPCEYMDWDLQYDPEDASELQKLQNQICLYAGMEPLKSYLSGDLDRFYLKLCISKEDGASYETQAAMIDRDSPQPLPEGISAELIFSPSIRVSNWNPFRGRCQLTVSENASPGEIAAYLPDTVPVTVTFRKGSDAFTECVLDYPITWKPLSFASLTPGESVTIADAAEPIIIPAGTQLCTPHGTFYLDEALSFDKPYSLDVPYPPEMIDLVINVVAQDAVPSGALSAEREGLELAFDLKPTGATAIQISVCTESDTEWTQLSGFFPLDAIDDQPSTENSGYAVILGNDTEPYRSYLAQKETGDPTPFFVGVKISGGVYDGKQLILPWPTGYDLPLSLPKPGGSGGNENNAGSDDKSDSTDEGQRPNLPENPSGSSESSGSSRASGSSGSSGSSGLPEPAGGQPSEPDPGTQAKPETPDASKPGVSDPQSPDLTKPEVSDPKPTDRPKPVRPSEQKPAQEAPKNNNKDKETNTENPVSDPEADTGTASQTSAKTGTTKTTVAGGNTYASENSVTGSQTRTAKTSATDKSVPVNDSLSPAGETPAVQGSRAKTDAPQDLQQTPDRDNRGEGSHPVLPVIAAAVCLGICIAAVKKTPKI